MSDSLVEQLTPAIVYGHLRHRISWFLLDCSAHVAVNACLHMGHPIALDAYGCVFCRIACDDIAAIE